MLIQVSLTNYRNFNRTTTLDLSAAKITEFPEHLYRDTDGLGIVPMATIYGANACGKTNFLNGIFSLRQLILEAPTTAYKSNHFFQNNSDSPIEYDILFRIDDKEYDYQLKLTPTSILEENLFGRNLKDSQFHVLFDRDHEGVFLCKKWQDVNVALLPDQYPLLYFLGTQTLEKELQTVISYFKNIIFLAETTNSFDALAKIISVPTTKQEFINHLTNMDLDITDIKPENDTYILTHTISGKSFDLSWDAESFGSKRLLFFLAELMIARQNHTLVLVDNPEMGLHPKILQYLYRLIGQNASFHSQSQVLLATHETSNMNHSIFRRDELWLMEKESDSSSHLYTLALFLKENSEKVRKDEVYFKQYLEGRYGAIPRISTQ